jgi:hypothetical protein
MRFNNRACALMEIPDLPQSAFEHCGDGKIKPQGGGGGGIISAITDPISSALGTDGGGGGVLGALADIDPGPAIGSALASVDPGPAIGSGLAEVDTFVNREIPGGWVTPALIAAAVAAPYAAPYLTAEAAAAGAAEAAALLDAAALAEGGVTAGMAAAANTGIPLGTTLLVGGEAVSQALPYTIAADAANLAANGFDAATIAQNLTATGLDSFVAADAAALAAQGLSEGAIAQNIAQGYTAAELAGTGLQSTLPVVSKPLISPSQAIQGARLGMGLLGGQQQQQAPQLPQMGGSMNRMPQGGVDYTGIYNLLALQRARNPNSLLG